MSKSVVNKNSPSGSVKHNSLPMQGKCPLSFTFSDFRFNSISTPEFNNCYKDESDFITQTSIFLGKALPLLSNEDSDLFKDGKKMDTLHLHKIEDKSDVLRTVFTSYGYSETAINNFLEGQDLYQFEVPYLNGASRVVFQRIENLISFLFMDPNHHVYLNRQKVKELGSLYYEECPQNKAGSCVIQRSYDTCFFFDALDEDHLEKTFGYSFNPPSE